MIISDVFEGNLSAPTKISVVFSTNSVFKHRDLREHVYTLELFVVLKKNFLLNSLQASFAG